MALKLVSGNVEELPVYNFQDIAGCARRFADQLEAGEQGEPTRIVVVLDTPEGVALCLWGKNVSGLELIGLFGGRQVPRLRSQRRGRGVTMLERYICHNGEDASVFYGATPGPGVTTPDQALWRIRQKNPDFTCDRIEVEALELGDVICA